jgi:hypothetical protein
MHIAVDKEKNWRKKNMNKARGDSRAHKIERISS